MLFDRLVIRVKGDLDVSILAVPVHPVFDGLGGDPSGEFIRAVSLLSLGNPLAEVREAFPQVRAVSARLWD